jgi:mannose-6-phosphate isomerase-like protein (cupin superfamily)
MSHAQLVKRLLIGTALAAGIPAALVYATSNSGSTSTLLGRATFKSFKVERKQLPVSDLWGGRSEGEADRNRRRRPVWEVEAEARPALDIATQTITFQPGGHSGWHSHPGPVFISVLSGTMTFYESDDPDCQPILRKAGEGYLDTGEHAHIARNETSAPATNLVTYLVPPGAALRIDEPFPGNCPF